MRRALVIAQTTAGVAIECSYCRTVLRTVSFRAACPGEVRVASAQRLAEGDRWDDSAYTPGTPDRTRFLAWAEECPACGEMNEIAVPLRSAGCRSRSLRSEPAL